MKYYNKRKNEKKAKIKEKKTIQIIIGLSKMKGVEKGFTYKCSNNKINVHYSFFELINKKYTNNKKLLLLTLTKFFNSRKYFSFLRLYIISFINYTLILSGFNKRNILFELSEITLKTNGTRIIKIFSDNFFKDYNQCDIYINNILQNETKNEYNFSYQKDEINIVKITWNITLSTAINMFSGCYKIIEIDLSKFESSNIINMGKMFFGCTSLISINLSGFNTSKVKYMTYMFCDLKSITSIDLSSFDTSNVIAMSSMFKGMTNITSLDLSTFDTSNVTGTDYMFNKMTNLTTVYVSDLWDISHITIYANSGNMFSDDTQLVGGAGTTYDSSHINGEYARVDDPQNGNPGYFTLKTS